MLKYSKWQTRACTAAFALLLSSACVAQPVVQVQCDGRFTGTAFFTGKHTLRSAAHVFMQPGSFSIVLKNGKRVPVRVVNMDKKDDVCMLFTAFSSRKWLKTRTEKESGSVSVLGAFPTGLETAHGYVYAHDKGFMSGLPIGKWRVADFATATVRGGYSGGPVLSADGKVVGVLTNCNGWRSGAAIFTPVREWD